MRRASAEELQLTWRVAEDGDAETAALDDVEHVLPRLRAADARVWDGRLGR